MPAPEDTVRRLTITFLSLTILVAGCTAKATAVPPRDPHVLRWGIVGLSDIPTLDPALAADPTSISVVSLVFGGLVRLDQQLRVQPDGASHWDISPDGTAYTFYLRTNLRFADGRPVTASDFATSIERALGPERSAGTGQFYLGLIRAGATPAVATGSGIAGIQVIDDRTLRLTLTQPAAHFLAELAFPASFVVEGTQVQRFGQSWTDHAAGFGPYMVRTWRHSRVLSLVPNPYYQGGKSRFSRITLRFYQDPEGALRAYGRGKLDVVTGWQAGGIALPQIAGVRRVPGLAQDYLAFNTTRLPFSQLNVRRALSASWSPALARQTMQRAVFPARNWLPSALGLHLPLPRFRRSGATFLAKAHYPAGQGFPRVTLIMPADPRDPRLFALASAMSRRWSSTLGIDVAVRQLNVSDYAQVLQKREFDIALVRWGADYPDLNDYLGTQLGSSTSNVTGWSSHAYNDAILLADSYDPTDIRRRELYREAARLAVRKLPLLPLDEPAQTALIAPDLRSIDLTPLGTLVGDWRHAGFAS
jgi:ABC-type oligopeptide transport system substrate-binding subunit